MQLRYLIIIFLALISSIKYGLSQSDSLIFNEGDVILGDLESMKRGVLKFSTDYSDSDFEIEWDKVNKIHTSKQFFIALKKGKQFYGTLNSVTDTFVQIYASDSLVSTLRIDEIVQILPYKMGFKDRFEAEIDVGYGSAKSNNLRRLSMGLMFGYNAKRWRSYFNYSINRSTQDDVDLINRSDAELVYKLIIYKDWYLIPSVKYLSNTEQKLIYRINTQLGIGNLIVRSNYAFWGLKVGINRNNEDFENDAYDNKSWEGYIGTEADLFNIGDLRLYLETIIYKGISEKERWRLDGSFNIKYDLPRDFYVKLELSGNYDNMPTLDGSEFDYITLVGIGWEW